MTRGARTNPHLATQSSAYLRAAATQPVEWHPWGTPAFERARTEDKPVLVDVGASWCHWCHVMDEESYEDASLAAFINEHFVAVKVDRDERPDVDARLQRLVSRLTGQGGWPLTAILTPQGDVFFGGTYFPPRDAAGRPAFRRILESVAQAYLERRSDVVRHARALAESLRHVPRPDTPDGEDPLSPAWLGAASHELEHGHDPIHGGWGDAPKFPHPSAVELLLARCQGADAHDARAIVAATLDGMARGGIRDQLEGGFHRYSVDAEWGVPHFEKMLFDNAELLRNYTRAARLFSSADYAEVARGVVGFLDTFLADRERGGFRGSQDADAGPGDDGDHYTWTWEEVEAAAGDADLARLLRERFGVEREGGLRHNRAKNVLRFAADAEDLAAARRLPLAKVGEQLGEGMRRLRRARAARRAPTIDPGLYTNWNAMTARAYFDYAAAFDRPEAAALARRTVDRFLAEAHVPGRGFAHALGQAEPIGLLDDNAQMLVALLAAFNHAQQERYLENAESIEALLWDQFWDEARGAFRDVGRFAQGGEGINALDVSSYPLEDTPSPSANARALEGSLMLATLLGDEERRRRVLAALRRLLPGARRAGVFGAATLLVAFEALDGPAKVVIGGPASAKKAVAALHSAALRSGDAGLVVTVAGPTPAPRPRLPEVAAFLEGPARSRAGAMVCRGNTCTSPVSSPDDLQRALETPPVALRLG